MMALRLRAVATVLLALAVSGGAFAAGRRYILLDAGTPTVSSTGIGTTGTATKEAGTTDSAGVIILAPSGSGISSSGTISLTLSEPMGINGPVCVASLQNGTAAWHNEKGSVRVDGTNTVPTLTWHNDVALTSGSTYKVHYQCQGK